MSEQQQQTIKHLAEVVKQLNKTVDRLEKRPSWRIRPRDLDNFHEIRKAVVPSRSSSGSTRRGRKPKPRQMVDYFP